jgi:ribosomal protein L29
MKEFLKKSDAELMKLVNDKRESLRLFRFGVTGSKVKNMKEGKTARKEIARMLTVINSKRTEK